jgi:cytochrome c-type biogenesis protein CcmE
MHPSRKRKIRLVVALTAAVVLASALVYTSFSASSEAVGPGKLLGEPASSAKTYKLVGKVEKGSLKVDANGTREFRVQDRDGRPFSVPVRYHGQVPDPFREGREVSVVVKRSGETYVGEKDSLVTKCPSKYTAS